MANKRQIKKNIKKYGQRMKGKGRSAQRREKKAEPPPKEKVEPNPVAGGHFHRALAYLYIGPPVRFDAGDVDVRIDDDRVVERAVNMVLARHEVP